MSDDEQGDGETQARSYQISVAGLKVHHSSQNNSSFNQKAMHLS